MADVVRCPVCGASNPAGLERCRACNQLLEQSTKELNGFGERIASGETPTKKRTSELEKALPAWLRHARQTDQDDLDETPQAEEETPTEENVEPATFPDDAPIFPDFSAEEEDDEEDDDDSGDWLAGLASSSDSEDDEEESADWLKNLQGDLPAEEVEETPEITSSNDISALVEDSESDDGADWLSNLQDTASEAADDLPDLIPQESSEGLPGEDGVPDWLSRLSDEAESETASNVPAPDSTPKADAQPASGAGDDAPDWLGDLQSVGQVSGEDFPEDEVEAPQPPAPTPPVEETPPADDESDLPDWMANLRADEDAPAGSEEPIPTASADDLPDWLSGDADQAASTSEAVPAKAGDDLPDWMANLRESEEDADAPVIEQAASDDLPDWLTADAPAQAASPAESDDALPAALSGSADTPEEPLAEQASAANLPDWLSGDEPAAEDDLPVWSVDSETTDEEASAASPIDDTELPDWLSGDEPVQAAAAAPTSDDDLPDWMSTLQAEEETSAEVIEEAASTDDLPDWMANLSANEDDVEESPEWLAGEEADVLASKPAFDTGISTDETEELPAWMAGLQEDAPQANEALQQASASIAETGEQESEASLGDEQPAAEEAEVPEWLSRVGKPTTGSLPGIKALDDETSPELEAADQAPDWLDSLPGIDDLAPEGEAAAAPAFVADAGAEDEEIFGIDMPDWLSNLAPEDLGTTEEQAAGEALPADEADLSGAELPSWVQAMRPVETVVETSESDDAQVVVESGPLAGLSGILPIGAGIGPKSKPKAHALKLHVNESQQHGAQLLEQILESEGKATARASEDVPVSAPLLRWLIAALMIVVVAGSLFMPQELVPSPDLIIPEVGATLNTINALPEGGTVLVVFDYEAALSAELQAAAAPVIDHIMLRGQKVAVLSSTPSGPALAESFMRQTQSQHNYQDGVDYINLGYLPGGASGILSFVSAPRAAVAGRVGNQSFWDLPLLTNITQFTDFSAVVILTDDVEMGRAWVEQASAALNATSTPFLMAVSAQTEPIMYPYYASRQVDGLVSGLNGGATYERLQGQSGLGREYWDAYGVGLLTAEILIVIGAVLSFMSGLRARKNIETEEE